MRHESRMRVRESWLIFCDEKANRQLRMSQSDKGVEKNLKVIKKTFRFIFKKNLIPENIFSKKLKKCFPPLANQHQLAHSRSHIELHCESSSPLQGFTAAHFLRFIWR
jgi:hypothetical protein